MIQLIRGFKDILPDETELWQYVVKTATSLFQDFGYLEICTPIMEKTELFARSIGEGTDIVEKEMYTFPDRKGTLLTLRPEATASIVRAYIQHKLYSPNPIQRLYTLGPMFRRERPQKGRYRQFYQIDVEIFGIQSSYSDVELIFMLNTLLTRLLGDSTIVHLNSLGCPSCRPLFKSYLLELISGSDKNLCNDCIRRKDRNPLRILDCKTDSCREVMKNLKGMVNFLCPECSKHFDEVTGLMNQLDVPFKLDKHLVRGLDYYTRTAFEIQSTVLESKNALAGGGRYDGLVKTLGGPDVPAIGFAIGLNRLTEMMKLNSDLVTSSPDLFIVILGDVALKVAFEWQMKLNCSGFKVLMGRSDQSLKAQMRQANRVNALHSLIVGEQELQNDEVIFRWMKEGTQIFMPVCYVLTGIKNEIIKSKNAIS